MSIVVFPEEDQHDILTEHNRNKSTRDDHIPIVLRNSATGWPMLQVSIFSPTENNKGILSYEEAAGGGKCHFVYTAAFCLASLLANIPGKTQVQACGRNRGAAVKLNPNFISGFLDGFKFTHITKGISIVSEPGMYGKTLDLQLPVSCSSKALSEGLIEALNFAMQPGKRLRGIDVWGTDSYTATEIRSQLDLEIAQFYNGQIFIDLGAFFDKLSLHFGNEDPELVSDVSTIEKYFRNLFKVDDFLELMENNPELRPKPVQAEPEIEDQDFSDEGPVRVDYTPLKTELDRIRGFVSFTFEHRFQLPNDVLFAFIDLHGIMVKLNSLLDEKGLYALDARSEFNNLVHQFDNTIGNSDLYQTSLEKDNLVALLKQTYGFESLWETWNSIINAVDKIMDTMGEVKSTGPKNLVSRGSSLFTRASSAIPDDPEQTNPRATCR